MVVRYWRRSDVLRSMWRAVAIGKTTLRTLRQARAWTHRASAQPGLRAWRAGGYSLDGVLGVARGCGSGRDRCSKHDLRRRDPYFERPATRGHGLAAAAYHRRRMVDPGKSRGRLLRRLGLAAARGVGTGRRLGHGLYCAVEVPDRYRTRRPHAPVGRAQ